MARFDEEYRGGSRTGPRGYALSDGGDAELRAVVTKIVDNHWFSGIGGSVDTYY